MKVGFKQRVALASGILFGVLLIVFSVVSYYEIKQNSKKELTEKQILRMQKIKVNEISKTNVNSMEEISSAAEHLSKLTANLKSELGKFKS